MPSSGMNVRLAAGDSVMRLKDAFDTFGPRSFGRAVQFSLNQAAILARNAIRDEVLPNDLRTANRFTRDGIRYELDRSRLDTVASVDDARSAVFIMPMQSAYLKYSLGERTRLPGDVGIEGWFSGTDDARKAQAETFNRSLGQLTPKTKAAEDEFNRLSDVLREVERELVRTAAQADKAGKSIEAMASAAARQREVLADRRRAERDLERGLADPRRAMAAADAFARAHERAMQLVIDAAIHAREAVAAVTDPADVARVKIAEAVKVQAAQTTADKIARMAARTASVAKEVTRAQEQAAAEAARAQEKAAEKAAKAWERRAARLRKLAESMPTLGGTQGEGIMSRLRTQGSLSVIGGAFGSVFSAVGAMGGAVLGVIPLIGKGLGGIVSTAGRVVGSVLSLGAAIVTAGVKLAYHLGASAVSLLGRLGAAAAGTAAKVASIAKTVVIRATVVGAAGVGAGLALTRKATADAAAASKEAFDGSVDSGTGLQSFQALQGAAKRSGVDLAQFNSALSTARQNMASVADNPQLLKYFEALGVGTRTADGRMRDTTVVMAELMQRMRQLDTYDQRDLLTTLFGSEEAWQKIYPMLTGMASANSELLSAGLQRQSQLGSLITYQDVTRQRAFAAATYDLQDAWKGLKLAVSRAIGDDVIRGMVSL